MGKAQAATHLGKDFPVGAGFAGGWAKGRTEGHHPLGVGHGAGFFAPLGGGQQQVGKLGGFGGVVGILVDGEGRLGQGGLSAVEIR